MKKIIITLLLLTSLAANSQTVNLDLTIRNIIPVDFNAHLSEATALIIPEGKICMIQTTGHGTASFNARPNSWSSVKTFEVGRISSINVCIYLIGGTKVWSSTSSPGLYNVIEFNTPSTQTGTLAFNEIKDIDKKIELFPNPTNSKITLNSQKNYSIEIYDMQGNIVMKDIGNTIDLSNLSNAVYILKAYDNFEKITTTYKVVKK
jgi:hypothetical protein